MTVQHLQETGIGRTVNALRKEPGDVGPAARALVYKWKAMVAAESSDNEGESNTESKLFFKTCHELPLFVMVLKIFFLSLIASNTIS